MAFSDLAYKFIYVISESLRLGQIQEEPHRLMSGWQGHIAEEHVEWEML